MSTGIWVEEVVKTHQDNVLSILSSFPIRLTIEKVE